MKVNTGNMINITAIASSSLEYKADLATLAEEANTYLLSHSWCKKIIKGMLDRGWSYILGVFYFEIEPAFDNVPTHVWVIVGDIPPAYIDVKDNPNGACAIDGYVSEMQRWVDHVKHGKSVDNLIPVNAPPSLEYAEMLQTRLNLIRDNILLNLSDEIASGCG
jgi:hypothetical protein